MKIGFVLANAMIGGYQTFLVTLANRSSNDHEVFYTVVNKNYEDSNLLGDFCQGIERVSLKELVVCCDIIHITMDLANEHREKLKNKWDRVVIFLGSYPHKKVSWLQRFKLRKSQLLPKNVIAETKAVGDFWGADYKTIRFPVDIEKFYPFDGVIKKYDLAILGRMRPVKNHKLFSEICQKGNFSFIAIGGTHRWMEGHVNDIELLLRERAVPGRDLVTGFVPHSEVVKYLNLAKVALIVSDYE